MNRSRFARIVGRAQGGFVLIIVLIVLVAMMLAGVSIMNSVNTAGLVAGNMAFRQAAIHAGDIGAETAVTWLETNNAGTALFNNVATSGYFARQIDPDAASSQTWDDFWKTTLDPSPATRPVSAVTNSNSVITLPTDTATGTTVSYVIHRLCADQGDPTGVATHCAVSPFNVGTSGSSRGAGYHGPKNTSQQYYRITSRIEGPRNTVSYVQTIVAL